MPAEPPTYVSPFRSAGRTLAVHYQMGNWEGRCPDCGSDEFWEGPHGGANVNVRCKGCGTTLNILEHAATGMRMAQRI